VATPLIDNQNGRTSLVEGNTWGGTGLKIDGVTVTFTLTEIVDFDGNSGTAPFRTDANGQGIGIDSPGTTESWFLLDGLESFTWTASSGLQFEGLSLRQWNDVGTRQLSISSSDWVGLSGVSSGAGITYTSGTGTFLIEEVAGNVVNANADALILEHLVGASGPTLDFSSLKIGNSGSTGSAIRTVTLAAIPEPATLALLGLGIGALALARRRMNK
jgi:hypothetical protein